MHDDAVSEFNACPRTSLVSPVSQDTIMDKWPKMTGAQWEKAFLRHAGIEFEEPPNKEWSIALHLAIAHQTQEALEWNPTEPGTPEAAALFAAIQKNLRSGLRYRLLLFSAMGTTMDWWHHGDVVIMISGEPDEVVVTLDLTVDPKKPKPQRSNKFVVRPESIYVPAALATLAAEIARELERLCGKSNGGHKTEHGHANYKKRKREKKKAKKERN